MRIRSLFVCTIVLSCIASAVFALPNTSYAVGAYENSTIADIALKYIGESGRSACVDAGRSGGDQCKQFVNCIVYLASGHSQYPVDPNGNYQNSYSFAGGIEIQPTQVTKGDIVQVGSSDADAASGKLHSAVVISNLGLGKYEVVDSNFNYDGIVRRHVYTPSGARYWRMGTVTNFSVVNSNLPTGASPIKNGGFNASYAYWGASGRANIAQYANNSGTVPYEGSGFVAANASQQGDSINQTADVGISAADTYCASARLVTIGPYGGGSGALAIWMLGGLYNEVSTFSFSGLAGNNAWQPGKTCVTATTSHSQIKVQIYPDPGAPTIGVDAVDVHQTLSANGGFNNGFAYWNASPGTNYTTYSVAQTTKPYEGSTFAATNTAAAGGSIAQDLPRSIGAGDTFCLDAQLVTVGDASGAAGSLVLWLIGGNSNEYSAFTYSNLPGGSSWSPAKTCVTATTAHTAIRVQLYPAVNAPTVGVDALDVHASLIKNSGFNVDSGRWSAVGSLSYMTYQNVDGTLPYEGSGFQIIQAGPGGGSFSQTQEWNVKAGDTYCAEASVVAAGYALGGTGTLALWIMNGPELYGSSIDFTGLKNGSNWRHVKTCTTAGASVPRALLKVEFYPASGGPAIGIDAVELH